MAGGKRILLTAPLTESIDHAGYFIQMSMASLPIWLEGILNRKYPKWRDVELAADGAARYMPAGLRVLEASLGREFPADDIVACYPADLDRFIGPETRVVAVSTHNPLGVTFAAGLAEHRDPRAGGVERRAVRVLHPVCVHAAARHAHGAEAGRQGNSRVHAAAVAADDEVLEDEPGPGPGELVGPGGVAPRLARPLGVEASHAERPALHVAADDVRQRAAGVVHGEAGTHSHRAPAGHQDAKRAACHNQAVAAEVPAA